jgi:hypothetical protein
VVLIQDEKPRKEWKFVVIEKLIHCNDGEIRTANEKKPLLNFIRLKWLSRPALQLEFRLAQPLLRHVRVRSESDPLR